MAAKSAGKVARDAKARGKVDGSAIVSPHTATAPAAAKKGKGKEAFWDQGGPSNLCAAKSASKGKDVVAAAAAAGEACVQKGKGKGKPTQESKGNPVEVSNPGMSGNKGKAGKGKPAIASYIPNGSADASQPDKASPAATKGGDAKGKQNKSKGSAKSKGDAPSGGPPNTPESNGKGRNLGATTAAKGKDQGKGCTKGKQGSVCSNDPTAATNATSAEGSATKTKGSTKGKGGGKDPNMATHATSGQGSTKKSKGSGNNTGHNSATDTAPEEASNVDSKGLTKAKGKSKGSPKGEGKLALKGSSPKGKGCKPHSNGSAGEGGSPCGKGGKHHSSGSAINTSGEGGSPCGKGGKHHSSGSPINTSGEGGSADATPAHKDASKVDSPRSAWSTRSSSGKGAHIQSTSPSFSTHSLEGSEGSSPSTKGKTADVAKGSGLKGKQAKGKTPTATSNKGKGEGTARGTKRPADDEGQNEDDWPQDVRRRCSFASSGAFIICMCYPLVDLGQTLNLNPKVLGLQGLQ